MQSLPNALPAQPLPAQARWLALGRAAVGGLAVLTLALVVAGLPVRLEQLLEVARQNRRALIDLQISAEAYAGYLLALDLVVVAAHLAIALFVAGWCRTQARMALLIAAALVTNGALVPLAASYTDVTLPAAWRLLVELAILAGLSTGPLLLFAFPDGRFVPGWSAWLAGAWVAWIVAGLLGPAGVWSFRAWPAGLVLVVLLAFVAFGIYAQIHRYLKVSSQVERQQTKWAVVGLTAAVAGPFAYFIPFVLFPSLRHSGVPNFFHQLIGPQFFTTVALLRLVGATTLTLVLLAFPVSFAVAVLRYRLWDIDLIIRRTLVYSVLTALLALAYLSLVILLQAAFRAVAGEESPLAVVVTTLAIAALAAPLRRRVQDAIDRRFYRSKYNAAQALAGFAATLRDETDLDAMAARLVTVMADTMQPEHVTLWLKPLSDLRPLRTRPAATDEPRPR